MFGEIFCDFLRDVLDNFSGWCIIFLRLIINNRVWRSDMKKIISAVLLCFVLLSSLMLSSCDDTREEAKATSAAPLVLDNGGSGTEQPDLVKGKTPRQLAETFVKEYKSAKTFDISVVMTEEYDGESYTEQVDIKLSEEAAYVFMSMEDMKMTLWSVGGVTYVDMDGEKYRSRDTSVDDIFGEGFIDSFLEGLPSEFPEEYIKKLNLAKLEYSNGEYYFSVSITAEEAVQMDLGDEAYTETLYFNLNGKLTKIVDVGEDYTVTVKLNSYGEKITVTPPEDAASFEDMDTAGGGGGGGSSGTTSSAEYKQYLEVCNAINNATKYQMRMNINDEPYLDYETDGKGEMVAVHQGSDYYVMWSVGGVGYVMENYEDPRATTLTNDMREAFTKAKNLKSTIASAFDEDEMELLSVADHGDGTGVIYFDYVYGAGTRDAYSIEFERSGNKIIGVYVQIDSVENYSFTDSVSYYFAEI